MSRMTKEEIREMVDLARRMRVIAPSLVSSSGGRLLQGAGEVAYTLWWIAPPGVRIVPYYPTNSLIISGPPALLSSWSTSSSESTVRRPQDVSRVAAAATLTRHAFPDALTAAEIFA
jgi:hypothetical protein